MFFVCHGRGTNLQKTLSGVFRCLIHQLLLQASLLRAEFEQEYQVRCEQRGPHGSSWNWHEFEVQDILESYLKRLEDTGGFETYVFVDALDECGEQTARHLLNFFRSFESASRRRKAGTLRICVSSRHYPFIDIEKCLIVSVGDRNTRDIQTYLENKLRLHRHEKYTFELLISAPTLQAAGLFQWAVAVLVIPNVIRALERKDELSSILKDIQETPQQLHDIYHHIVRSNLETKLMMEKDRRRFRLLFQWVALARRPFTLAELRRALVVETHRTHSEIDELARLKDNAMEPGEDIWRVSCGLIRVTTHLEYPMEEQSFIVQFNHQSIQDYFISGEGIRDLYDPLHDDPIRSAQLEIVETCLWYIRAARDEGPTMHIWHVCSFSFVQYASENLFLHARAAEENRPAENTLIELLGWPSQDISSDISRNSSLDRDSIFAEFITGGVLCVAATFNIPNLVQTVLRASPKLSTNSCDDSGLTALHWAAKLGHVQVVEKLLELGSTKFGPDGNTPYWVAKDHGYEEICKLLKKAGAKVEDNRINALTRASSRRRSLLSDLVGTCFCM